MSTPVDPTRVREIIRQATLAASSHNTQPWKFTVRNQSITVLPDLTRRCPIVDPNDQSLVCEPGLTPKSENDRCAKRLRSSAGIRNAFLNQPVEVAPLRSQFAAWLGAGQRRTDLLVRFG
jgi:hypothetical protein